MQPGEAWATATATATATAPELGGFGPVFDQDEANLVALRRGMRATGNPGLDFGEYQESRIRHFNILLDSYLNET